jgi:RNA polymerase primary sigma factor
MTHGDDDSALETYLDEVRRTPLLTASEEAVLGRAVQEGLQAERALRESPDVPERAGLLRRQRRGAEARDAIVRANLRLVVAVARKYAGRGLAMPDLVQEGNLGLMHAAGKFDHWRGFKFSTYATWWIRHAVSAAVMEQARAIRLPVHLQETLRKVDRVEAALVQGAGRDVCVGEIAAAMGQPAEKLARLRRPAAVVASLDTPLRGAGDTTLGEQIADPGLGVEEGHRARERRRALEAALARLPTREATVLRHRLGLVDDRCWTLTEVGRLLGVTRERVRQVESSGLRRLREPEHAELLRDLVD